MNLQLRSTKNLKPDSQEVYDLLSAFHDIDVSLYEEHEQGDLEPMLVRFPANTDSYLYLVDLDQSDTVAGYINYFPVSDFLFEKIMDPDTPFAELDDGILISDVLPFRKTPNTNHVFILSVIIRKEYQGGAAIKLLTNGFVDTLKQLHQDGYKITDISGCAVSDGGRKLLRQFKCHIHHLRTDGYTIMLCNNEDEYFEDEVEINRTLWIEEPETKTEDGDDDEAVADDQISDHGGSLHQLLTQDLYYKSYHDDVYLLMPLAEHPENTKTDLLFYNEDFVTEGSIGLSGFCSTISKNDNFEQEIVKSFGKRTSNQKKKTKKIPEVPSYFKQVLSDGNPTIASRLIFKLRDSMNYECANEVADELDIFYLGCYDFLSTTDQYPHDERTSLCVDGYRGKYLKDQSISETEIVIGHVKGYVLLTAHQKTHLYSLTVFFPDYPDSTTQLEDQISNGYLKIVDPRYELYKDSTEGCYRYIRLYDFLKEELFLHRCGQEKVLVCMSKKPAFETEMQNILAAEVFNSSKIDYHINSPKLREMCETNHAQYDYYEVLLSNRSIVFIPAEAYWGNLNDRIDITATYAFIAELVMFQNSALARMNIKVTKALSNQGDISIDQILELDQQYGQTIPFWEPTNFKYNGTQEEAACIREAFSNDILKSAYDEYQEYLEDLSDLQESIREDRSDTFLNVAATALAIIQIESFLMAIFMAFYQFLGIDEDTASIFANTTFDITFLVGLFSFIVFVIVLNRRKSRKQRHNL